MNLRILKLDLSETNEQLRRIADALEGILGATDPLHPVTQLGDVPELGVHVEYTNDAQEIVEHHLRRLGKELRERTPKE